MKRSYHLFGLTLESEFEIPGLPLSAEAPDVLIRKGSISGTRFRTTASHDLAIIQDLGRFLIRNGNEIIVDLPSGSDSQLLEAILTGRIMAYLLRQRGLLPLHASGIRLRDGAILFMGASGSGKSTTAAAFVSAGHTLLTDDIAPLRIAGTVCQLQASRPRLKLLSDSLPVLHQFAGSGNWQIDKYCFDLDRNGHAPLTNVSAIYLLGYGETIAAAPLRPYEAVAALSENTMFSRRRAETEVAQAHLSICASIANNIPLFKLTRPCSLAALPDLIRFLEASNVS